MRLTCFRRPCLSANFLIQSRRLGRNLSSHENANHAPTRDHLLHRSLPYRQRVLNKLVKELSNTPAGEQRQLPVNHLDIIATELPHTLLPGDPAVHWISFLLRNQRAQLATRVFSIYLHRGIHFSLSAIQKLCIDASHSQASSPASVFAEQLSQILNTSSVQNISILNNAILTFYDHGKYDAVLKLTPIVLKEDGPKVGSLQFRRILQSILKVYRGELSKNAKNTGTIVESLLLLLAQWIRARRRDVPHLDQYDIAILIQGLSPLLKKNHRGPNLPRHLHSEISSLLTVLNHYISSPVASLSLSEAFLNNYDGSPPSKRRPLPPTFPLNRHQEVLSRIEKWYRLVGDLHELPITQLPAKARALKIIARERLREKDETEAVKYMHGISTIHNNLAARLWALKFCKMYERERRMQPYVVDSRQRFVGALIQTCSACLQTQNMEALLTALFFTQHLSDLATFVRLWKRSLHLAVQKGDWGGPGGLLKMLKLLSKCTASSRGQAVGELLFTGSPSSSNLLRDTLYVALGPSLRAQDDPNAVMDADRLGDLVQLIREKRQRYREWCGALDPLVHSLPLPWRDALKKANAEDGRRRKASMLLLKRLENRRAVQGKLR